MAPSSKPSKTSNTTPKEGKDIKDVKKSKKEPSSSKSEGKSGPTPSITAKANSESKETRQKGKGKGAKEPKSIEPVHEMPPSATDSKASKSKTKKSQLNSEKEDSRDLLTTSDSKSLSKTRKRTREEPDSTQEVSSKRQKAETHSSKTKVAKDAGPKKKKVATPSEESSGDDEEEAEIQVATRQDGEDEEVYLHGFSTDEDSSDDEGMEMDALDVKKLPFVAKDDTGVQKRLDKAKKKPTSDPGVLYIGRIPHGFYEAQMKEYFTQFGNVTRLRLARNKKTGRSKHYAFIEFDSSSVAQIVSETMDNYLLAGHLLQCKVIPPSQVHPDLWIGANRKYKLIPKGRVERLAHNKTRSDEQKSRAEKRLIKRQAEKAEKIKAAGIQYSLDKIGYSPVAA